MAISDTRGVRHVRCPKCHSVLQEPNAPVYQCGGCGTSLRAKNRNGNSQEVVASANLQSKQLGSSDVASTSGSTPDTPITRKQQGADTTSRRGTGDDLVSARTPSSEQVASIEKDEHDQSTNQQDDGNSDHAFSFRGRDAGGAQWSASALDGNAHLTERRKDGTTNLQDQTEPDAASKKHSGEAAQSWRRDAEELPPTSAQVDGNSESFRRRDAGSAPGRNVEHRRKGRTEPDAADKKNSDKAVQPRRRDVEELAPRSSQTAASQSARAVLAQGEDAADAAAERKAMSPPRHEILQKKILKTVDELRGDLSEFFSKSPEFKPRTPARRPPRLPRQEGGHTPHGSAMATSLHDSRARHAAAAAQHPRYTAREGKSGQVAPRGLPSRRYRRCRAEPCCHDVHSRACHHHGCCAHHGESPACSSCRRAQVCRPSGRAQEASAPPRRPPPGKEAKRRAPPRNHCRPVLKGAPFIVCSSCFELVQVPADFAVASSRVRKLRCGACSAVLSYSYRDPDRKKKIDDDDQYYGHARRDPFSFIDDLGNAVDASYSTPTEDERPLHVSRNSSFDTVDEIAHRRHGGGVSATATPQQQQSASLHRLMGYGSASDLLFRQHSPDLYESFDMRSPTTMTATPDAGHDRKGKGVCVDVDDGDDDDDDSDEEGGGALKRSRVRGSEWRLPGMTNKGMIPGAGAIRIKS